MWPCSFELLAVVGGEDQADVAGALLDGGDQPRQDAVDVPDAGIVQRLQLADGARVEIVDAHGVCRLLAAGECGLERPLVGRVETVSSSSSSPPFQAVPGMPTPIRSTASGGIETGSLARLTARQGRVSRPRLRRVTSLDNAIRRPSNATGSLAVAPAARPSAARQHG
jgi:hypothetical protein